jgi:hypothetical protein
VALERLEGVLENLRRRLAIHLSREQSLGKPTQAIADIPPYRCFSRGLMAQVEKHGVSGSGDVGERVEQRAVEIESDS